MKLMYAKTQIDGYGYRIQQDPTGKARESHRILQESTGNNRNLSDFFSADSSHLPEDSGRNRSEIIGKNPKIFRWEYCFHVPAISGAFLPEPARIFRPGNEQEMITAKLIKNHTIRIDDFNPPTLSKNWL